MLKLKRQVSRIAQLDKTILISGESGTGKELVAKSIHAQSKRSGLEMISINCATIPESLIEVELFGDVNAESSNVVSDYPGLIESADQSSLFWTRSVNSRPGLKPDFCSFQRKVRFKESAVPRESI